MSSTHLSHRQSCLDESLFEFNITGCIYGNLSTFLTNEDRVRLKDLDGPDLSRIKAAMKEDVDYLLWHDVVREVPVSSVSLRCESHPWSGVYKLKEDLSTPKMWGYARFVFASGFFSVRHPLAQSVPTISLQSIFLLLILLCVAPIWHR